MAVGSVAYAQRAASADSLPWGGVTGAPMGLDDGDDDTLGALVGAAPCTAGTFVSYDGTAFTCVPAPTTSYTAGTGLVLSGNEFAFDMMWGDMRYLQQGQANSISSAMIQDGAVAEADLANGSVGQAKLKNSKAIYRVTNSVCIENGDYTSGQLSSSSGCSPDARDCSSCSSGGFPTIQFRYRDCRTGNCGCTSDIRRLSCSNQLFGHVTTP
jgi:hypothetical protein